MSNVTLRNVNLLRLGTYVTVHTWKSTGCCVDGLLLSGQIHWSENSGAFMEGFDVGSELFD